MGAQGLILAQGEGTGNCPGRPHHLPLPSKGHKLLPTSSAILSTLAPSAPWSHWDGDAPQRPLAAPGRGRLQGGPGWVGGGSTPKRHVEGHLCGS